MNTTDTITTNTITTNTITTNTITTNTIDKDTPGPTGFGLRRAVICRTALAGVGVLLLAACGGSGDDTPVAEAAGTVPDDVLTTPGAGPAGADGFEQQAPIDPGSYQLESLGVPVEITLEGDWWVRPNVLGHTAFSHPNSGRPGDRDVVLLRPTVLSDPTQPGAAVDEQAMWPVDDIDGWFDNLVDGIVTSEPTATQIGGSDALYFEAEVSSELCGTSGYCAGFIVNTVDDKGISGWSFEPGFHQRVWWVDGGNHEPLVIIASTPSGLESFHEDADQVLDSLVIGEPGPHPVPNPGT